MMPGNTSVPGLTLSTPDSAADTSFLLRLKVRHRRSKVDEYDYVKCEQEMLLF